MSDPRAAFERFVRWVMRDVTYDKVYAATVELDRQDQTFDVRVDDPALRGQGLSRVPVLVGVAGARVQANNGTRCLVGFVDRDPRKPRIVAWQYQANSGKVSLDNGTASVARQGDFVRVLVSDPAPISGVMSGQTTIPGPPPVITPIPAAPFIGTVTGIVDGSVKANIGAGGARRLQA